MTTHTLSTAAPDKTRADVVVVGIAEGRKGGVVAAGGEPVAEAYGRKFAPLLASLDMTGKAGSVAKVSTGGTIRAGLLLLVGLGPERSVDLEAVRRAAGVAARSMGNVASAALALPASSPEEIAAVVEGWELGGYRFEAFKDPSSRKPSVKDVVVLTPAARTQAAAAALEEALVVSRAAALARDWVNTPPGDLTPAAFADAVLERARAAAGALAATVLDEQALEEGGYGGIIGVGRGSQNPPRLVELTYTPDDAVAHLALVGKGITFDSGGLSIKPAASMVAMKCDMGGAAAVLAATIAIADLGLPVAVTTFAPLAENMPSGSATRPGDVLSMLSGKTVEVLNTDAEGRLVLADGLHRATQVGADRILDVATLTGACVMALGDRVAGVMGNDDTVVDEVHRAGDATGDAVWPLPLPEEMTEKVRTSSKVADLMQHNVDRWGGALYAGAFLQEFVADQPWAHLDIAGPAFNDKAPHGYTTTGGTGFGVRLLVEVARRMAERETEAD